MKDSLVKLVRSNPSLQQLFAASYEAYVLSYPKTGRTWLRVLLGKALCLGYGLPEDDMLKPHRLTRSAGLRVTRFAHEDAILDGKPYYMLDTDKRRYRRKRVLLLVRDVRDTLVSCYFQATRRDHAFSGSISEFVRSDAFGARKVVHYYDVWYRNHDVPRELRVLRYEDMHRDPGGALRATLDLIGSHLSDPAVVDAAVEYARFGNMRRLEARGKFEDHRLRPGDATDGESFKVRKGVVGGFHEYLSPDDVAYIDDVVARSGCPYVQPST